MYNGNVCGYTLLKSDLEHFEIQWREQLEQQHHFIDQVVQGHNEIFSLKH